jgi:hypothetical protein
VAIELDPCINNQPSFPFLGHPVTDPSKQDDGFGFEGDEVRTTLYFFFCLFVWQRMGSSRHRIVHTLAGPSSFFFFLLFVYIV